MSSTPLQEARRILDRMTKAVVGARLGKQQPTVVGCNYGEATALRWSDIDEVGAVIRIERTEEMTEHYSHVDRAEKLRAADQVVALAGLRAPANDNTAAPNGEVGEKVGEGESRAGVARLGPRVVVDRAVS